MPKLKTKLQIVNQKPAAKLLTTPISFEYFEPFMSQELSASQAAKILDCRVDTLTYWLKKFLHRDLLFISKLEKRRGRPTKIYRSSADEYLIPYEFTPYAALEERLLEHYAAQNQVVARGLVSSLQQAPMYSIKIYKDEKGKVHNDTVLDTSEASAKAGISLDFGGDLLLTPARAEALKASIAHYGDKRRRQRVRLSGAWVAPARMAERRASKPRLKRLFGG